MKKILIYTGIFLVGFAAVSFWAFYLIISPPNIEVQRNGVESNMPKENVELTTEDGINLSAWFIPSDKYRGKINKKAVILLHGYPSEKSDMLGFASKLHPDVSVLLLDLRSFGESEDTYTTLGIREQKDVTAAVKYLSKKGYNRIGIFGISLGSTAALLSATNNKEIDAVGVDTSFSDIKTVGYRTFSSLGVLKYPLVETMPLWSRLFFGKSIKRTLQESARKIDKPILVTRLQKDRFSINNAIEMKALLQHNKKAEFYFPQWKQQTIDETLEERVKRFFKENL